MVELDQLKDDIANLGNRIKELKSSGGDKDAIGKAVQELIQKKQLYADNNDGIGVDGKPFKANMTKAEKKKQQQGKNVSGADHQHPQVCTDGDDSVLCMVREEPDFNNMIP